MMYKSSVDIQNNRDEIVAQTRELVDQSSSSDSLGAR